MDQSQSQSINQLVWGPGMMKEGKQYIVETQKGFYKGTYKTPDTYIPYIILYNVTKNENKMAQVLFYRTDKFYDADEYIKELKYRALKAQMSMEKRALNEILRQLVDENYV